MAKTSEKQKLKDRISKLTDIINWMSNGNGCDIMEENYDMEMEREKAEYEEGKEE